MTYLLQPPNMALASAFFLTVSATNNAAGMIPVWAGLLSPVAALGTPTTTKEKVIVASTLLDAGAKNSATPIFFMYCFGDGGGYFIE